MNRSRVRWFGFESFRTGGHPVDSPSLPNRDGQKRSAAVVADHSVFLCDPGRRLERLYSTADMMLWQLFGTPDETRRAAVGRADGSMAEPAELFTAVDE